MSDQVVFDADNLCKYYDVSRGAFSKPATLKALDGVSFQLSRKKTLAVVGESGCGKSTLARLVTMLETPTSGTMKIAGNVVNSEDKSQLKALRPKVQIVFQNPYGSLNPRQKIGSALAEPLAMNTKMGAAEMREKVHDMMDSVGLRREHYDRYPHMFSGGQRQRIAIARALMMNPDILVLDEPVSALDVSIQAQVLNLLGEIQDRFELSYLFISHDLSVVKHIADEVLVMYLGRPVEQASRDDLFASPQHPYTKALLSATPIPIPGRTHERIILRGELPSPLSPPSGCTFNPRCSKVMDHCHQQSPEIVRVGQNNVACHLYND